VSGKARQSASHECVEVKSCTTSHATLAEVTRAPQYLWQTAQCSVRRQQTEWDTVGLVVQTNQEATPHVMY